MTYDLIETTTLDTAASSVTFSSITQDYRDLVLVVEGNLTTGDALLNLRLNSDASSSYTGVYAQGNGSSEASGSTGTTTSFSIASVGIFLASATKLFSVVQIMDYTATDKHKSVLARSNNAAQATDMRALRYASTSAITNAEIIAGGQTFAVGSSFSLYGIAS